MIRDGVDPEEAVTRYVSADIAALRNVDRMREIMMDSQRKRDLICGYEFAEYIDAHFKNCKIFRSPNHPTETLTLLFATEVFKRLGLEDGILGRLELVPKAALFPPTEMPIHPSIIAHFGLSYVDIDTRYRFFDEGSFTFAEYAARYMRYEWNPLLGEGYSLVKQRELAAAVEVLRRAVKLSPRSAAGYSVLSGVLHELGRLEEARACANIAVRIEPDNPHYVAVAAHFQTELAT
jgi:tetratricopeptide (TPR) repeat protein